MYSKNYYIPNNRQPMFRNSNTYTTYSTDDDRFFWAPFVVGGLAGTALGYGIANNNQINGKQCCQGAMPYPVYYQPYQPYQPYQYPINNNFYY